MRQPPIYPRQPFGQPAQQPLPHQRLWRWFRSRSITIQLLLSILILSCGLCTCVMSVVASTTKNVETTQAPTPTQDAVLVATTATTDITTETPTDTPTLTPTSTPTMSPTPVQATQLTPTPTHPAPTPTPTPKPQPTPTPTHCVGVNNNPWCYDFNPGNLIYSPPSAFCNYFPCVSTFWSATRGYVAECTNGSYTHSGGVSGACSRDGGVMRALYSH